MEISEKLFQKYNIPVPRYTSYPPATSFHTNFTGQDFVEQIKISNNAQPENISIYIHIPFASQRLPFLSPDRTKIAPSFVHPVITVRGGVQGVVAIQLSQPCAQSCRH